MSTATQYHIRWLIRRDLDEIHVIERDHACGLSEEEIMCAMRQKNQIGVVAESCDGPIDGYAIYSLQRTHYRIERLAVHKICHRSGVGRTIVNRIKEKLSRDRFAIEASVPEWNVKAQLFFASCGFVAIGCDGDAIEFRFENTGVASSG